MVGLWVVRRVVSTVRRCGRRILVCGSGAWTGPNICAKLTAAPVGLVANKVDWAQPQVNLTVRRRKSTTGATTNLTRVLPLELRQGQKHVTE